MQLGEQTMEYVANLKWYIKFLNGEFKIVERIEEQLTSKNVAIF